MTKVGYLARALARADVVQIEPAPSPDELVAWRAAEGLTQTTAARLAGVELRAWQRWEYGDRAVPQWLADVLRQRWGSAP